MTEETENKNKTKNKKDKDEQTAPDNTKESTKVDKVKIARYQFFVKTSNDLGATDKDLSDKIGIVKNGWNYFDVPMNFKMTPAQIVAELKKCGAIRPMHVDTK